MSRLFAQLISLFFCFRSVYIAHKKEYVAHARAVPEIVTSTPMISSAFFSDSSSPNLSSKNIAITIHNAIPNVPTITEIHPIIPIMFASVLITFPAFFFNRLYVAERLDINIERPHKRSSQSSVATHNSS